MTDETEHQVCTCKERLIKDFREFLLRAGAVFVGATLAILVCTMILKPKLPPVPNFKCPMMHYGFERQMPPHHYMRGFDYNRYERRIPPRYDMEYDHHIKRHHRHHDDWQKFEKPIPSDDYRPPVKR